MWASVMTLHVYSLHHVYAKRSTLHDGKSTVVAYRVAAPLIATIYSTTKQA